MRFPSNCRIPVHLGFLATGDGMTSNNGLYDQILALTWVHENAHVFGGDPSNVLLMGQGSGASAASILGMFLYS